MLRMELRRPWPVKVSTPTNVNRRKRFQSTLENQLEPCINRRKKVVNFDGTRFLPNKFDFSVRCYQN